MQVALKPGDYNAYDSLGEALDAAGQTAAAGRAGARAVALSKKVKLPHGIAAQLRADAARYAKGTPSPVLPAMKATTSRYHAALAQVDSDTLLRARSAGRHPAPQSHFVVAASARLADAGRACRRFAGSLAEAWVRLVVPAPGGPPSVAKVIEPGRPRPWSPAWSTTWPTSASPLPAGLPRAIRGP